MAEDSKFDDFNTNTDIDALQGILAAFAPQLAAALGPVITQAFGSGMTSQFGMPGGGMGFGSTTFFGQQDVGQNLAAGFQQNAVNSVMADPIAAGLAESDRQLRFAHQAAGGGSLSPGEIDKLMNSTTAVGLAHNLAFNQRQPHLLNQGLREGIQYMGVGFAPDSPEHQMRLRDQTAVMTSKIAESFNNPANAGDWGGMLGQDVGRVFAEMGRTGSANKLRNTANAEISALGDDASSDDIDAVMSRLGDETLKATQQAARSVQAFRQIFKGSVTDVVDMVNGLVGTDIRDTLEGAEAGLFQNFSSTGNVAGFSRHQMSGFAGLSAQMSQSQGLSSWGAVASGTFAAQLLSVRSDEHGGLAFINEPRMRQSFIQQATSAQQSELSQQISGAAAVVQDRLGDEAAQAFRESLTGQDLRSGTDVARAASAFRHNNEGIGSAVDSHDIFNAGDSAAGRRLGMAGVGVGLVTDARVGQINRTRMIAVEQQLSAANVSAADIKGINAALQGQGLTMENIMGAAGAALGDNHLMFEGALNKRFDEEAGAHGFENTAALDKWLASAMDREARDRFRDRVNSNVELQDLLSHKGKLSGISNLSAYISKVEGKGTGFKGAKEFVKLLSGDTDVTANDVREFANVSEALIKSVGDSKSEDDDHGLSMAITSLATQTIGDRRMTGKEVKDYQAAITSGDLEALTAIGKTRNDLEPAGLKKIEELIGQIIVAIDGMPNP